MKTNCFPLLIILLIYFPAGAQDHTGFKPSIGLPKSHSNAVLNLPSRAKSVSTVPSFNIPDTVCVNTPVSITNTSVGATSYFWNFCVADINTSPTGVNLGNIGGLFSAPVFIDYVLFNNNYYGFLVNYNPGKLIRLDFGSSLLNTPTAVSLGDFGGIIPVGAEGIQLVFNESNWYAIIVGGNTADGYTPRILKIDFGPDLTNLSPIATNWNNLGNMSQPIDLHIFKEGSNWYGFTTNALNNTITRFDFTNSFNNTPTAVNLGNIGNLSYPTGIYAIDDNGFWRVFVVNGGDATRSGGVYSLTRLDFGSSLLNIPTGVNLGNPGNVLQHPRDLTIMKMCNQIVGFAVNGHFSNSNIVKLNFNNDLSVTPAITSLGVIGNSSFPHSISKLFRVNSDVYGFITNVDNNTLTRLKFTGCTNSSIPNSTAQNPPAVVYNAPGTYSINLTIDDGLPTQAAYCKQVVVLPTPLHSPTKNLSVCTGGTIRIGSSIHPGIYNWNTGESTDSINVSIPGIYWVESDRYGCSVRDSFIVSASSASTQIFNSDTTIFAGDAVQLNSISPSGTYSWTPATYLNCSNCSNPIASPLSSTTYILNGADNCGPSKDSVKITVMNRPFIQCSGFQMSLGSLSYDRAFDVVTSVNNEFYAIGVTRESGNDDILVTKLDLAGNILWAKKFGGNNAESVRKASATSDGGLLITGQTKSFTNPAGEILCMKISNSGNLVWSRKFGLNSASGELGMDIIETSDGGYAVSGILDVNGMVANGVVIKLNSAANIEWSKKFDHLDGDDGVGIVQKGDTLIAAVDLQTTNSNYSFVVMKLKISDGSYITGKRITPAARGLFNPYLYKNPSQSGYIISGHTIDGISYSNMKQTLIYLNDNFDIVSTKLISMASITNDFFTGFVPLSDGSFLGSASPQANSDGYVYRISANNSVLFAKKFNGASDRRLYRLATSGQDVIAVGGTIVNGQEDFFITNFKTDGTLGPNCETENVSLTIEQPVYSSASFLWPVIDNLSFSNTNAGLVSSPANLNKNDICPKPLIDFGFQQSVCNPKTVQFSSNISGIQSYQWNFGNGQTNSTSLTPYVTYANFGTYPIKLNVNYGNGCSDSLIKAITLDNVLDNTLISNNDTTICLGDSVLINSDPAVLNYCWTVSSGSQPSSPNAWVKPTVSTVYSLNSQSIGANLVINGDFSQGNTGFSSQYNFSVSGLTAGVYNVGSNITSWHPGMAACQDHTTGNGNMMMVNGADQPNIKVWTQTIPVQPNTNYVFYTWLQTITTVNPSQLQFSINGISLGNIFNANAQSCIWDRFSSSWNSGNNTSATISIMNMSTQFSGNDFALDDIFFGELKSKTDTLRVNVTGLCDSITINGPDKVCDSTDILTYSIYKAPGCDQDYLLQVDNSFAEIISRSSTVLKLRFRKNGSTSIRVTYPNNCKVVVDSLAVTVRFSPSIINLGPDVTMCRDTSLVLNAGKGFESYLWQNGTTDSVFAVNSAGNYYVTTQNLCGESFTDSLSYIKTQPLPFGFSPQAAKVCVADSVQFSASGGTQYSWTPAANFAQPNSSTTKAWINSSQNFTLTITDGNCLRDTLITIPVESVPAASIKVSKSNDVSCEQDSAVIYAQGGASYTWQPNLYISRRTSNQITVRPPQPTTYYITGVDAMGCTGMDSITIDFKNTGEQRLFMPNAFTPNGDGLNDLFCPIFTGPAANYEFSVYNRWGQLIFHTTTPRKGWDGTFRSRLQPGDVYVYYFTAEGGCNGKFKQKGTFVLIR